MYLLFDSVFKFVMVVMTLIILLFVSQPPPTEVILFQETEPRNKLQGPKGKAYYPAELNLKGEGQPMINTNPVLTI